MPQPSAEVAILIVCHEGRALLEECLGSVLASRDPGIERHVIVVDNASADDSAAFVAQRFPDVDLVRSAANLGFAGGNNLGWEHIRQHYRGVQYVVLLNQDTVVQSGWLVPLLKYAQEHPEVACVQSKLLLHPDTSTINSAGNQSHFLGFGLTRGYGHHDNGQYNRPATIDFASGAAMMVRADLLRQVGLFDELMFLYLEDAELSWRLRQMGYSSAYVPESVVYHKYHFDKKYRFYFYLERNRWWLLGVYYKTATLLLLLPALLLMELGQLHFAHKHGVVREKLRGYGFFLKPLNLSRLRAQRRQAQTRRTISDRQFMTQFTGSIHYPELDSALLRYVGNPLLSAYWSVARRLIFW
jgi:GT2 family glycosyltransferase